MTYSILFFLLMTVAAVDALKSKQKKSPELSQTEADAHQEAFLMHHNKEALTRAAALKT